MTDDDIIEAVLNREKGWSNKPADRGGPTNWGITQSTLARWRGTATADDVKRLKIDEARAIYRNLFVHAPGYDKIPSPTLRALIVDMGVNHGTPNATRMLQRALDVLPDAVMGPITLAALSQLTPPRAYARVVAERARFYGQIISRDHTQAEFAGGWMNRLAEFIETAPQA